MSRQKQIVKGGPSVPKIRENSRLMHTHESMVDLISGRRSVSSLLDALAPAFLGLHFSGCLDEDLMYSDDDDDDDDDDDEDYYPRYAAKRNLQPHPQIKQLTDEEADKIAKELIDEEERRKGKTQRNKRKKQRKKEKKRLEKEIVLKENVPEEEQEKLDSSEDQEQMAIIDSNSDVKKSDKIQMATEAAGCDEDGSTKKNLIKVKKKDENQKCLNLKNSCASSELVPEEKCSQKSKNVEDENKSKEAEVQQLEEEKPEVVEKQEVEKKEEGEASTKETVDSAAEEFAKKSIDLAAMGNRVAAAGLYTMAVTCYTDAIKYNPKEFKLFGNRSLCYERLQQYENALRDADVALSMEPNWIKGLFRKGKALCGLKRYYEASLIYKDVLKLESTSTEAAQELKRAQTLHLMEMGFSWAQSSEALKSHATLEEAVEALFAGDCSAGPEGAGAMWGQANQSMQEVDDDDDVNGDDDEGQWTVLQGTRPRSLQVKDLDSLGQIRSKSQSPTPHARNSVKPELFPVWVGTLAPTTTYVKLHELFSRAGTVYSIKMLLEQLCAFVNYTRQEDCERAIECINGMVVEGATLTVRYPFKHHHGLGASSSPTADPFSRSGPYKKECFFWRTTGCMREDCTYRHIPEHKNIDRDKFTGRLGYASYAGDRK